MIATLAREGDSIRYYELNPLGVEALRAYFDRFWNHALAAFAKAAETQPAAGEKLKRPLPRDPDEK